MYLLSQTTCALWTYYVTNIILLRASRRLHLRAFVVCIWGPSSPVSGLYHMWCAPSVCSSPPSSSALLLHPHPVLSCKGLQSLIAPSGFLCFWNDENVFIQYDFSKFVGVIIWKHFMFHCHVPLGVNQCNVPFSISPQSSLILENNIISLSK